MASVLGIDIGGTGIKAALVDTGTGDLESPRHRVPTPRPATPDTMASAVGQLLSDFDYTGTVGCCFPTVVAGGRARTVSNLDESWRDVRIDETLTNETGLPFVVLNDADAAGVAEMRFGAGAGLDGLVLVITLGTGIGSGMFYRGQLVPNIELGWMAGVDGEPLERYASNRARKSEELSWDEWGQRLDVFLTRVNRVCSPDHLILGGGVSKKFAAFKHTISVPIPIHVAQFKNNAGIVGAAMAAAEAQPR